MDAERPPLPPFTTVEAAAKKARMAEDAWNSRDPERVSLAYTADSEWRNRAEFIHGRSEIVAFLTRKWARELDYRLIKELWGFRENRMAVRFAYEWRDDSGSWFRSYGNENWEFDEKGLMRRRFASINDLPIRESDRKYHWPLGTPSGRPSVAERPRFVAQDPSRDRSATTEADCAQLQKEPQRSRSALPLFPRAVAICMHAPVRGNLHLRSAVSGNHNARRRDGPWNFAARNSPRVRSCRRMSNVPLFPADFLA